MPKSKQRGHGEGTIYQRQDKRWVASFKPEGGKRIYLYGKTRKEAFEKLQKAQQEEKQGILATGPQQKLADYLPHWLETVHKPSVRLSSYVQFRTVLHKHLVPALGDISIRKLTAQHIQAFYAQKLKEGYAPRYIALMQAALHKALENAVKWNLVSRNVASTATPPRPERYDAQVLTSDEARQLLEVAKDHKIEALLLVALTTGMRRGELLALRWSDVNMDKGILYIRRTVNRFGGLGFVENDPKTKTSRRRILLPDVAIEALKAHQGRQEQLRNKAGDKWLDNNLIFSNRHGGYLLPDVVRRQMDKLLAQAGLSHIRFHDLRHSAATILLTMGVHPKVVQELLGHSSISITLDTYSHLVPSIQQEATNKMNDVFKR